MNCMKCGRDTQDEKMFCEACLASMEKYPVAPNTVVVLPKRARENYRRSVLRRWTAPSLEIQVNRLQRWRLGLLITVLVLTMLIGLLIWLNIWQYEKSLAPKPGQNYSTMETTASTED